MIHVVAFITATPGERDSVLADFLANVPAVHAEAGCIEYGPAIDPPGMASPDPIGPDTFAVIEKWESPAHLEAHAKAPHMLDYRRRTADRTAARVVHILSSAG